MRDERGPLARTRPRIVVAWGVLGQLADHVVVRRGTHPLAALPRLHVLNARALVVLAVSWPVFGQRRCTA